MPIGKLAATKRGKTAVAAALVAATLTGWTALMGPPAGDTPATVRAAISQGITPPAVDLAVKRLIKPWEGLVLKAHWDRFGKVWDICYGDLTLNGQPVRPGMTATPEQCEAQLTKRFTADYYLPMLDRVKGMAAAPISVQASMSSGAYNFGVGAAAGSTAARHVTAGRYAQACEALTAFNRAGGRVVRGLVLRREMGDAQRLGEAELCLSGLPEAR